MHSFNSELCKKTYFDLIPFNQAVRRKKEFTVRQSPSKTNALNGIKKIFSYLNDRGLGLYFVTLLGSGLLLALISAFGK